MANGQPRPAPSMQYSYSTSETNTVAAAPRQREIAAHFVMTRIVAERSAEAPASTDGANLKLQGQSLALTPVASSGWFGDVFILQKSLVSLSQRRRTQSNVRRTRLANPLCASAPWRLSDKNETQNRKDAKSQSIKPGSVPPPNEKREPREAAADDA